MIRINFKILKYNIRILKIFASIRVNFLRVNFLRVNNIASLLLFIYLTSIIIYSSVKKKTLIQIDKQYKNI